jgi:MBG domain (YGX type)
MVVNHTDGFVSITMTWRTCIQGFPRKNGCVEGQQHSASGSILNCNLIFFNIHLGVCDSAQPRARPQDVQWCFWIVRLWLLAVLSVGVIAEPLGNVVYDSLPEVLAADYIRDGFESAHLLEIGDRLTLAGSDRRLVSVTVILSSWARSEDFGNAASYVHPLTLRLYGAGSLQYPGPLLATVTQPVVIPYRPSGWVSNGIAFKAVFELGGLYIPVTDNLIYTVSANTSHFGTTPTGSPGNPNYNQLGFAYSTAGEACGGVRVGFNDPGDIFDRRDSAQFYWDQAMPSGILRRDTAPRLGAAQLVPMVRVTADSSFVSPSAIAVRGAGSFMYSGTPQGPVIGTETGSTGVQTIVYAGTGSTVYGPSSIPPVSAGTYMATAFVAADSTHLPAASRPFPFNICPAPLIISATDQSKFYGTTLDLSGPQTGFTVVGLVGQEIVRAVTITASGGTQAGDHVGTYGLMPKLVANTDLNPGNYVVQYLSGYLRVLPAPLPGLTQASVVLVGQTNYLYQGIPLGPTNAQVTGITGAVSIVYSGVGSTPYPSSQLRPIQPGDYQAVASVLVNTNFLGPTSPIYSFSITLPPTVVDTPLLGPLGLVVLLIGSGWMGAFAIRTEKHRNRSSPAPWRS